MEGRKETLGERGTEELEGLRERIDSLDSEIVSLLEKRAEASVEVGKLKAQTGIVSSAVFQPAREAEVYERVIASSRGTLSPEALRAIYSEILSSSRALQSPLRVGYLGPEGTFTHEAALKRFGQSSVLVPVPTIEEVFFATERGEVDFGVVGAENSTAGAVIPTLDVFLTSPLQICDEVELAIAHNLLSLGSLESIKRVYSHPQALAQCRRWLMSHLPDAIQEEVSSTTLAAKLAQNEDTAAIGPAMASKLYGLSILAPSIQDSRTNITRFFVLGKSRSSRTGHDRMSLVFSIKDRPGVLRDALEVFARRQIDLSRIESRPSRQQLWEYVFYCDLAGHPDDSVVGEALAELDSMCYFVKVLGAWPEAARS